MGMARAKAVKPGGLEEIHPETEQNPCNCFSLRKQIAFACSFLGSSEAAARGGEGRGTQQEMPPVCSSRGSLSLSAFLAQMMALTFQKGFFFFFPRVD